MTDKLRADLHQSMMIKLVVLRQRRRAVFRDLSSKDPSVRDLALETIVSTAMEVVKRYELKTKPAAPGLSTPPAGKTSH